MNIPRLTAGASIYNPVIPLNLLYRATVANGSASRHKTVNLAADRCVCTSPNCTWSC